MGVIEMDLDGWCTLNYTALNNNILNYTITLLAMPFSICILHVYLYLYLYWYLYLYFSAQECWRAMPCEINWNGRCCTLGAGSTATHQGDSKHKQNFKWRLNGGTNESHTLSYWQKDKDKKISTDMMDYGGSTINRGATHQGNSKHK